MSLTTQLHGGELARWCAENFVSTRFVAARVTSAAQGHRPVRPTGQVGAEHWAAIGGAFGQRLAFLVQPAPPYYALYGLVRAGIVSRSWADAVAARFPTHTALPPAAAGRALELRPAPGGWADLGPAVGTSVRGEDTDEAVLGEFFGRLIDYLGQHAPAGTLGSPGAEAGLARACAVISGWEDAYRSQTLPAELLELHRRGRFTVEELRAIVAEPVVTELVALARQLHTSGALAELRRAAGDPAPGQALGTAGPVFVHHWADGDLLVGRTLWDVKTVVRVDNPERVERWLWQLVAYAWLDTEDRWGIRSVGLYLARHGVLVSWGLQTFADWMLGRTGAADGGAREEFLTVARKVIREEGATPPGPWKTRMERLAAHVAPEPPPTSQGPLGRFRKS
jgi:hypothetical protein